MPSYRLIAKQNICKQNTGTVVIGKGMIFETFLNSSPDASNVKRAIKERYGVDVSLVTVSNSFEVIKL